MRYSTQSKQASCWLLWICLLLSPTAMALESGLDVLLREAQTGGQHAALLTGKRIGLVTNMTGVDRQLRSNVDLLAAHPGWTLAARITEASVYG